MINYEVLSIDNDYLIQGNDGNNHFWLIKAVFEEKEKDYADAFCRVLNEEVKRGYELGFFTSRMFFD